MVNRNVDGTMKFTIKTRLVLAMNLLVIGVGVAVGWAGVKVSGGIVEHRLVDESARNAAGIFGTMHLPFSADMMSRLQLILGAPVAAGRSDRRGLVASSLPKSEEEALQSLLMQGPLPRRVSLNGQSYLVGQAQAPSDSTTLSAAREPMELYLLVPESQVQAAQKASEQTIVLVTFIAILLANGLAFWLSGTISQPLRRLVRRMDLLASQAAEESPAAPAEEAGSAGPPELAQLARSFDTLVERLAEARHRLARSTRLATVGQLSAAVAHELRNPLSGIKMNAQVLAEELAKSGVTDSGLDRIIREVERMNVYLEELLELASDEVKPDLPHELRQLPRIRLEAVAESALGLVERRCQHGHIEVVRRWNNEAPWVRASEPQLRQVILNLVLNAIDAMPAGGRLTVATSPGAAGCVRLAVTDTGQGVQVPDNKDMFEPFVTTKSGGIGLGLYVCRRNIARHHGRIGYDSSAGGTTFWFELPAAD
jgi:signal transduction histidine kinase